MKRKKVSSQAGIAAKGYHFCAVPKCKTQMSDGSPDFCPEHQKNACPKCKGRGEFVWSHNEADSPSVKFKKCKTCLGSGQIKRKALYE